MKTRVKVRKPSKRKSFPVPYNLKQTAWLNHTTRERNQKSNQLELRFVSILYIDLIWLFLKCTRSLIAQRIMQFLLEKNNKNNTVKKKRTINVDEESRYQSHMKTLSESTLLSVWNRHSLVPHQSLGPVWVLVPWGCCTTLPVLMQSSWSHI